MNRLEIRGLTMAFNSSALTATGGETVHDSTVAMNFCINGKVYQKSGTNADQTTPTTDYNTGAAITLVKNQARTVVWAYNSSGTVKCMAGPVVTQESGGYTTHAPLFPDIPDDVCPFAYQVIEAGSTTVGTWTFGSSNWNATGISATIVNIATLPANPQMP